MYQFCDVLVREFKYMNKLQEDKILNEIGYREKRLMPQGTEPWQLYNEAMSVKSNPAAADYLDVTVTQGEKQKKRANSIHTFEVPKQYRRNPELVRAAR